MEGVAFAKKYVIEHSQKANHCFKLTTNNATNSMTITIYHSNIGDLGKIQIEKAIGSTFQKASELTNKQLHNCAIIHVPQIHDTNYKKNILPVLCYFALRQARIWRCQNIIFACDESNTTAKEIKTLLRLDPLAHCQAICAKNQSLAVYAQRIKYAIYHAYEQSDEQYKSFIQSEFINEILESFEIWVSHFFKESWFNAVNTKTITKEQYITSLYNMHQFVRHTTRLAARCVACSDEKELRNHYIYHLKGEINHEIIIESDLKGLGVDLDYLLNAHIAHTATSEFIVLQESIIGYKQDAVMMLACPFIAEGMTANISSDFVNNLHATIKSWGIEKPESVSRFLTSHMKFDGGIDGHWLQVIMMTHEFVKNELQLQHYLNTMRLAMTGYAHGFNANIDDLELWRPMEATAPAAALST